MKNKDKDICLNSNNGIEIKQNLENKTMQSKKTTSTRTTYKKNNNNNNNNNQNKSHTKQEFCNHF